ncbi:hypothetical protein GQ43DRAFT_443966 [Delitschia confertaspora ATCC 74209]|uniref:Coenzyme Q-binding protein COQ10 START domain-containing protein n=1 Tax=Delitschia confertaspora ATCC 74209 TaxID=1513339 RepID=A0A9P4MS83_9PLEO|nr:hypothetical protein GQ43DRAFT_443966 [Delitschia confertaspora ATCC 74209]
MATKTLLRLTTTALRPSLLPKPLSPHQRRNFLSNFPNVPFLGDSTPQILTATRTLPYPSVPIYNIISDVSSYDTFLPYCESSTVTKWSSPDRIHGLRWPSEATLAIGFKGITEEFTSRVYCVPGRVVEAVSGETGTSLRGEDIAHYGDTHSLSGKEKEEGGGLLKHLLTRWTVQPTTRTGGGQGKEQTVVDLSIEFAFANPLYTTLSAGAAPKVAEMMIRAFEERVRVVLERDQRWKGDEKGIESGYKIR